MAQTTMFTQATSHHNAIVSDEHSELASTAHSMEENKMLFIGWIQTITQYA